MIGKRVIYYLLYESNSYTPCFIYFIILIICFFNRKSTCLCYLLLYVFLFSKVYRGFKTAQQREDLVAI